MITSLSSSPVSSSFAVQGLQSRPTQSRIQAAVQKASGLDMNDTLELSDGLKIDRERNVPAEKQEALAAPKRELTEEDKKFRDVMKQFVGEVLFGQMLKSMRASQQKNPFFDGGRAEEIFQGQLDQIYVEKMTGASSNSLSDAMFNQMQRIMGKAEVS